MPAFKKPKSKNAATTLAAMGLLAVTMFCGIIALAINTHVRMAENPATDLLNHGKPLGAGYTQDPVIAQVAEAVFGHNSIPFVFLAAVTALVLFLAANTAYNGFPVLGSILAQDRYLPRQLHTRGDRLAFSNGIVVLAGFAAVLVYIYGADSTRLIQLYIVGVFVSFTLSQTGMVRHWNRHLRTETDPAKRRHMIRSRAINTFGAFLTGLVLVIVLLTKFTHGAWVAVLGMVVFFATMTAIRRHYTRVSEEIAADDEPGDESVRPSRVHSIVLVSKLHKPTLRALSYAKLMRSDSLEALSINVDPDDTKALQAEWQRRGIDVPLKVLDSPYREITRPIIDYVKGLRRDSPRDVVSVYIPEYVVGHWYEHLLHNQSALRLKGRLLFTPGVMVTSVPWQLESSEAARARARAPRRLERARLDPPRPGRPGPRRDREPAHGAGIGEAGPARSRTEQRGTRRGHVDSVRVARPARPARVARRRHPSLSQPQEQCRHADRIRPLAGRPASTRSRSARWRTAATASRAPTRARCSSSGTRCPASGSSPASPRARRARASCGPTPSRVLDRVQGPGRGALPASPGPAAAAAATGSTPAPGAQRRLKAAVVAEQLARLAGLTPQEAGWDGTVAPAPGDKVRQGRGARVAHPRAVRGGRRGPRRAAPAPLARGRGRRPLPDRRARGHRTGRRGPASGRRSPRSRPSPPPARTTAR